MYSTIDQVAYNYRNLFLTVIETDKYKIKSLFGEGLQAGS